MTDLDRRQLLGGGRRCGLLRPRFRHFRHRPPGLRCRRPAAQAPGFYRYKVGSFECTSINDGARSFPMPDTFVRNVPKEEALAAAEAAYMPKGMVTVPFNPQLINTGSKLILIDCGNGIANFEPSKGAVGRTLQNLAAAGVDPKSVDVVLMSHLHPDHTNGIRALDGSMAFPNAEIMVPAKDWEFWMSEENAAKGGIQPDDEELFCRYLYCCLIGVGPPKKKHGISAFSNYLVYYPDIPILLTDLLSSFAAREQPSCPRSRSRRKADVDAIPLLDRRSQTGRLVEQTELDHFGVTGRHAREGLYRRPPGRTRSGSG